MKRTLAYVSLALLSLLAACPKRTQVKQTQTPPPDYNGVRQDANTYLKALDQEKGPMEQ